MNEKGIIKKINRYSVISFDIFDTLIEREASTPTDIFELVEKRCHIDNFKAERISAEQRARRCSVNGEVSLDDIYSEIRHFPYEVLEGLKQCELEVEMEQCRQKTSIHCIYEWAKIHNKKVIIISDMYLPAEQIANMLRKCGYTGYEKLYISNEYGCNKISGKLFLQAINDLSLQSSSLIHLGDSLKADYLGAKGVRVKSILLPRKNRIGRLLHG